MKQGNNETMKKAPLGRPFTVIPTLSKRQKTVKHRELRIKIDNTFN